MDAIPYDDIPLVKGLPLVGNLPKFLRDPLANARSLEVHGNVVRSRTFFSRLRLSASSWPAMKLILSAPFTWCCSSVILFSPILWTAS